MNVEDKISKVQQLMENRAKNEKMRKDKIREIESKRKEERAVWVAEQAAKKNLIYPVDEEPESHLQKLKKKAIGEREHVENEVEWMGSQTKLNFEPNNEWKIKSERLSP